MKDRSYLLVWKVHHNLANKFNTNWATSDDEHGIGCHQLLVICKKVSNVRSAAPTEVRSPSVGLMGNARSGSPTSLEHFDALRSGARPGVRGAGGDDQEIKRHTLTRSRDDLRAFHALGCGLHHTRCLQIIRMLDHCALCHGGLHNTSQLRIRHLKILLPAANMGLHPGSAFESLRGYGQDM